MARVAAQNKYRDLLRRQERQNERLREAILQQLREHEDDVAQFAEIVDLAPSIFSSFMTEVRAVGQEVTALLKDVKNKSDVESVGGAISTR